MAQTKKNKNRLAEIGGRWIAQNETGIFYVHWFDEKARQTRRLTLKTADLVKAIKIVQNWQAAEFEGHPCDSVAPTNSAKRCVTVSDALQYYMEERGDGLASAEQAKIASNKLKTLLGKTLISKLDDYDIEKFVKELQEDDHSISYISRILSTLRAALNFAVKRKRLKYAPKIPEIRTKAHMDAEPLRGRRLTLKEVAQLFDAAREPHVLIYLVLLAFTLSRPCALLDLTLKQIDWDHANLSLNPPGRIQTKKHRPTLRISRTFFLWLGWAVKQSGPDGHLIHYHGEPIGSMKQAFRGLAKRAKLEGRVSAYSIRHTIAAYLRKCHPRVPADEISIVLGHLVVDSKKVTERYSPFDPDYLVVVTPAIEKLFLEVAALCKKHNLLKPGECL